MGIDPDGDDVGIDPGGDDVGVDPGGDDVGVDLLVFCCMGPEFSSDRE